MHQSRRLHPHEACRRVERRSMSRDRVYTRRELESLRRADLQNLYRVCGPSFPLLFLLVVPCSHVIAKWCANCRFTGSKVPTSGRTCWWMDSWTTTLPPGSSHRLLPRRPPQQLRIPAMRTASRASRARYQYGRPRPHVVQWIGKSRRGSHLQQEHREGRV